MKRGAPLKRTAFNRTLPPAPHRAKDREQRIAERASAAIKNVVARPAVMGLPPTGGKQHLKSEPIRSKAYLRLVAQLPCKHCGIWGHSQAAHSNTGKGMGTKACDLQTFPLCADRPGERGCHSLFDQGALFSKEARRLIEAAWVADTQRQIHAMGVWPEKYPFPHAGAKP